VYLRNVLRHTDSVILPRDHPQSSDADLGWPALQQEAFMNVHASSTRLITERNSHRRISDHPDLLKRLAPLAATNPCRRGQEICSQGHLADFWFRLVSGTARHCVVRADGRRQIIDLLLPGDFFGFTTAHEYDFAVEAVAEGTTVASFPRQRLEELADSDPQLAREIRQVAFETLSRLQTQLLTLGRVTALEKVSSFLLELASRSSDDSSDNVVLPISRYDIADYLALSVETVSRSLTGLKTRGVIRMLGTRIVKIVDRDALDEAEGQVQSGPLCARRSTTRTGRAQHTPQRPPHRKVGFVAEKRTGV
jgi:CRP/FNR family transcriptional regulator, nitrogen fixation regulation protein